MTHRTKFWLLPILLGVLAVGGLLLAAQPASAAGTCLADLAGSRLGCTAEDVAIAEATDICVPDGNGGCMAQPSCIEGSDVTFSANFTVKLQTKSTGGSQNRYDIGLWFATDGDPNRDGALTGQCVAATLPTGEGHDLDGDKCGDIDPAHSPVSVPLTITTKCEGVDDPNNPGQKILNLPAATSWKVPGGNTVCEDASQAVPSSSSKCKTQLGFTVNILVEQPGITVLKTANPTEVNEPGGDVTYNVIVTNDGDYVNVTINTLTDDIYDDITSVHGAIKSTGCTVPQTITPNNSYSCSFTATASGNAGAVITDTVTASGTDANGNPVQASDDASVTIKDLASPDPSLTKTAKSFVADVTFEVVVTNNSTLDTLTLNTLSDDQFGDITKDKTTGNSKIESTNCSVTQTIAPNASYTCQFVAKINSPTHTDTVTGNMVDDDGKAFTKSDGATVKVDFP